MLVVPLQGRIGRVLEIDWLLVRQPPNHASGSHLLLVDRPPPRGPGEYTENTFRRRVGLPCLVLELIRGFDIVVLPVPLQLFFRWTI